MSTGVESWSGNLLDIGTMYPFPGTEVFWVIVGVVFWLAWHVLQGRMEGRVYDDDLTLLSKNGNLGRLLNGEKILD